MDQVSHKAVSKLIQQSKGKLKIMAGEKEVLGGCKEGNMSEEGAVPICAGKALGEECILLSFADG